MDILPLCWIPSIHSHRSETKSWMLLWIFNCKGTCSHIKLIYYTVKSQELQLSNVIFLFLSIIIVFTFYGVILSKFYKRRKRFDTIKRELKEDFHPKLNKISFTKSSFHIIPINKSIRIPDERYDKNVDLKQIRRMSNEGEETKIRSKSNIKKKSSNLSRQVTFHVSYLRSSNYILVTLFTFWIFHSPVFVYQMIELFRWDRSFQNEKYELFFSPLTMNFFIASPNFQFLCRLYSGSYEANNLGACSNFLNETDITYYWFKGEFYLY